MERRRLAPKSKKPSTAVEDDDHVLPLAGDELATWDPYGFAGTLHSETSEARLSLSAEQLKSVPLPSEKGLCAMCLFQSMQVGKDKTNVQIALTASQRRYYETGYKELENLTHETYALSRSASSFRVVYHQWHCSSFEMVPSIAACLGSILMPFPKPNNSLAIH